MRLHRDHSWVVRDPSSTWTAGAVERDGTRCRAGRWDPSSMTNEVVHVDGGAGRAGRWGSSTSTMAAVVRDSTGRRAGRWASSGSAEGAVRVDGDRGHRRRRCPSSCRVVRETVSPRTVWSLPCA